LPPRDELPLRDEPELVERPKPPEELGRLGATVVDGLLVEVLEEPLNERCDWVGLERTRALAAIFSAFGEIAGWEMTGREDWGTVEPREPMEPV